ncbi:dhx15 [Symbiodinium natans]|uniref:Dhx15 protein n=1 Tax=Symbiodinium natans TaxID=878477 RepID=A0A812Q4Q1_9DINO|nr:dhx15 [Symbiodinium natans]
MHPRFLPWFTFAQAWVCWADGPLVAELETATSAPQWPSHVTHMTCNPFHGFQYLVLANGGGISAGCRTSWNLHEVEVYDADGRQLTLSVISLTGSDQRNPSSLAADGSLDTFWAGRDDTAISCACWDTSAIDAQALSINLGATASVSRIVVHQGGASSDGSTSHALQRLRIYCSRSYAVALPLRNDSLMEVEISKATTTIACGSAGCDVTHSQPLIPKSESAWKPTDPKEVSATLEAEKFQEYWTDAPVLRIPGRMFPVETFFTLRPEKDYLQAAVETCCLINENEGPGDILCFLCGEEEIEKACAEIQSRAEETGIETLVLPLYSSLPMNQQRTLQSKTSRLPLFSQSIHVRTMITSVLPEHPCPRDDNVRVTRASMSYDDNVQLPEHPCPHDDNVRVTRASMSAR